MYISVVAIVVSTSRSSLHVTKFNAHLLCACVGKYMHAYHVGINLQLYNILSFCMLMHSFLYSMSHIRDA